MSSSIFDLILVLHAVFALAWLGTLLAGLSPTLKLYGSSGDALTFRRRMMLRRLIAGTGGIAILMGFLLYYYIAAVEVLCAKFRRDAPCCCWGCSGGNSLHSLNLPVEECTSRVQSSHRTDQQLNRKQQNPSFYGICFSFKFSEAALEEPPDHDTNDSDHRHFADGRRLYDVVVKRASNELDSSRKTCSIINSQFQIACL